MKSIMGFLKRNKLYRYLVIIMMLAIAASVVYAASVPNIFISDTVISSSEVNDNFSYLEDRSWDLNGSDLYYDQGNVGIGTTAPEAPLHVVGVSSFTTSITVNGVEYAYVPRGLISMWSGTLASIPTGWQVCDGTNETPDLRSQFIYGAPAGEEPGSTGGSMTYNHRHKSPYAFSGNNIYHFNSSWGSLDEETVSTKVSGVADSTTQFRQFTSDAYTSGGSSGTTLPLPPYYTLAFIMKL